MGCTLSDDGKQPSTSLSVPPPSKTHSEHKPASSPVQDSPDNLFLESGQKREERKSKYSKMIVIRDHYTFQDVISLGSYSALFNAVDIVASNNLAYIRFIPGKVEKMQNLVDRFNFFVTQAKSLIGIVPYKHFTASENFFYVAMQKESSNKFLLDDLISNSATISEEFLADNLLPIMESLTALHERKICHGQISPNKIVLVNGKAMLFDFMIGSEPIEEIVSNSPYFTPPEVLCGAYPCIEGDVWALGATIFYLITGKNVAGKTAGFDEYAALVTQDLTFADEAWATLSDELKVLLQKMLTRNKEQRIPMALAMSDEWFSKKGSTAKLHLFEFPEAEKNRLKLQNSLTRVSCLLANEYDKSKLLSALVECQKSLKPTLSFDSIISKLPQSIVLKNSEITSLANTEINYASFIYDVLSLKQLFHQERIAALFRQLVSTNHQQLDESDIRRILTILGESKRLADQKEFEELIHQHQLPERVTITIFYREFSALCDSINLNIPEDMISSKSLAQILLFD